VYIPPGPVPVTCAANHPSFATLPDPKYGKYPAEVQAQLDEFAVYAEDKIDEVSAIGVPSECHRSDLGVTSE
jgi:hypothetical protein